MYALAIIKRYHLHHFLVWGIVFFGWHFFRYQDYPAVQEKPIQTLTDMIVALLDWPAQAQPAPRSESYHAC